MRKHRYSKISLAFPFFAPSKDAAVMAIWATAGVRANHMFQVNGKEYMYTIHPVRRNSDSQVNFGDCHCLLDTVKKRHCCWGHTVSVDCSIIQVILEVHQQR